MIDVSCYAMRPLKIAACGSSSSSLEAVLSKFSFVKWSHGSLAAVGADTVGLYSVSEPEPPGSSQCQVNNRK